MANNEKKQQIDDNVQDAEVVSVGAKQPTANRWLWLALGLLLVLMLASSWWLFQQLQQTRLNQQQQLAQVSTQTAALDSALEQSDQQVNTLQQTQAQLSKQLDELRAREQLSSQDLRKQWALLEVKYLLNVANQRALLAHDVNGARRALQMADKQLEQIADYRLHPLRALITEESMALDALADVDIPGMALKLQTAAKQLHTLRVKKGPEVSENLTMEMAQPVADSDWKQAVNDIWNQVRSLVVIRHDQTGESAVLVPEQRYFLYQNLRLQLESARLALLNADANSYRHSLDTAISWLQRYFTGDERDAMINMLTLLAQQDITVSIPDISGSLNWLEEYQQ